MTRLFIYEAITAGCFGASPPESLQLEGLAMLQAVLEDFDGVAGLQVTTLVRPGVEIVGRVSRPVRDNRAINTDGPGDPSYDRQTLDESAQFRRLVEESEAVLVIAPELGGVLAERCAFVAAAQRRSLGCAPDAVRLAADKLALADVWRKAGVPTPVTTPVAEFPRDRLPVVVKPRYGAGSQATRRIANGDDVESALRELALEAAGEPLIVQPWHAGLAASVSFLCGPTGDIALLPGEQCLSADDRCQYIGSQIPLPEPYRSRAVALGRHALSVLTGRNGYVGIDLVLGEADDGSCDVAIEINPRLTTSYLELRKLSRANLAAAWWQLVQGKPVSSIDWRI